MENPPLNDSTIHQDSPSPRLISLDQFRGYTVAAMFLVNFVGSYAAVAAFLPTLKHWNNHCSFADTVMPQFFFAVGFSFRLSYLKRRENLGAGQANLRILRRILGLLLVALIIHQLDGRYGSWQELKSLGFVGFLKNSFLQSYFQTLAHIGFSSLWVVPVIGARARVQLCYLVLSGLLFVWLSSLGYYHWVMTKPGIDGGPLGFLSWSTPLLLGSLAFDICQKRPRRTWIPMLSAGCAAMLAGYALSCLSAFTYPNHLNTSDRTEGYRLAHNPFVRPTAAVIEADDKQNSLDWWQKLTVSGSDIPDGKFPMSEHWVLARKSALNQAVSKKELPKDATADQVPKEAWYTPQSHYLNLWTMSQRAGSWSYMLFGGGLSMVILAGLMIVCDGWGWQLGLFRTLGVNALVAYILHDMVNDAVRPFVPRDAPLWWVFVGFGISFFLCYLILRSLEKQKLFVKL